MRLIMPQGMQPFDDIFCCLTCRLRHSSLSRLFKSLSLPASRQLLHSRASLATSEALDFNSKFDSVQSDISTCDPKGLQRFTQRVAQVFGMEVEIKLALPDANAHAKVLKVRLVRPIHF